MKTLNTSDRIKEYMDNNCLKQVDILKMAEPFCKKYDVKLTKTDLSQYVSGKTEPRQDKLYILSLALNVSEAWLMGYDVSMERKTQQIITSKDAKLQQLIDNYNKLNTEGKEKLLDYSDDLVMSQKYIKNNQHIVGREA